MIWLRWILLGAGALFMLGLFLWERRRQRLLDPAAGRPPWAAAGDAAVELPAMAAPLRSERAQRREPQLGEGGNAELRAPLERLPVMQVSADAEIDIPIIDAAVLEEPAGQDHDGIAEGVLGPATLSARAAAPPPLRVEWPPEDERRIIAVRVASRGDERLAGRSVRQGLESAGFVHGRFSIYHLPIADGRALLSAANLSRPGILDPDSMDFQSFSGLSLFAVLPGPLPAAECVEQLLAVSQALSNRLGARLQTEGGAPLDAAAQAALRAEVSAEP